MPLITDPTPSLILTTSLFPIILLTTLYKNKKSQFSNIFLSPKNMIKYFLQIKTVYQTLTVPVCYDSCCAPSTVWAGVSIQKSEYDAL